MNTSVVTLNIEDDLAIVTIDNPPVNASSHAVRAGLAKAVLQTNDDHSLLAVLLVCKGTTFMAGADIKEFGLPSQSPTLPDVINGIENARIPWLAVIHGTALGGGLELALGCRFRIADKKASFGFPEVNLGLIPGAGGTVRLPRLIAMQEALNLVTSGNTIDAVYAENIQLVDKIVSDNLLLTARTFARSTVINTKRLPISQQSVINQLDSAQIEKALVTPRRRRLFAKLAAIKTMADGVGMSVDDAMSLERQTFNDLLESDQSKALRYLFFAERSVSKILSLRNSSVRDIEHVGIVGGGTMGTGIAASALLSDLNVTLIERDDTSIDKARRYVENILDTSLSRGIINEEKKSNALDNFHTSKHYNALDSVDLVVEAVFEDMTVKKEVFQKLDKVTKPTAILASNTSYLDISAIANLTQNPSRVIGLHYFSPAHIMKLLEVVHTDVVEPDVLATALHFAKRTGKIPVPCGNCRGFIGNRIMSAYRRTSEYLLEDGALPYQVDSAMKNFGFPMGIFEMQDLAGLDIGWAMRKQLTATEKSSTRYVDIADKICEEKRFGRKTGSGYYRYDNGKTAERDPWVEQLIESESVRKGITRQGFSETDIISSILEQITNEAHLILQEGIADSPEAIDVVMVNGYGFPRWRGGPMYSAALATNR